LDPRQSNFSQLLAGFREAGAGAAVAQMAPAGEASTEEALSALDELLTSWGVEEPPKKPAAANASAVPKPAGVHYQPPKPKGGPHKYVRTAYPVAPRPPPRQQSILLSQGEKPVPPPRPKPRPAVCSMFDGAAIV
jgi:hypothetical protein